MLQLSGMIFQVFLHIQTALISQTNKFRCNS